MLKVNSTSSRNGGIGRVIMASIARTASGTPRMPRARPRMLPIIMDLSTFTPIPRLPVPSSRKVDAAHCSQGLEQAPGQLLKTLNQRVFPEVIQDWLRIAGLVG